MDETMRLFDVYKGKHVHEIERKHKEIVVKVWCLWIWLMGRMLLVSRFLGHRGMFGMSGDWESYWRFWMLILLRGRMRLKSWSDVGNLRCYLWNLG